MKSISFERDLRLQHHGSFQPSLLSLLKSEIANYPSFSDDLYPVLDLTLSIDYNHIGLSSSAYLNHPLRVALLAITEAPTPTFELIATSLLHNIKELSEESFRNLSLLPSSVIDAINLLTVDRSNSTLEYKDHYYLSLSSKSFVAQVKILDKLDNLFLLCLNPSHVIREDYLNEIETYLYPLVANFLPHLSDYFVELVADARQCGHLQF